MCLQYFVTIKNIPLCPHYYVMMWKLEFHPAVSKVLAEAS